MWQPDTIFVRKLYSRMMHIYIDRQGECGNEPSIDQYPNVCYSDKIMSSLLSELLDRSVVLK